MNILCIIDGLEENWGLPIALGNALGEGWAVYIRTERSMLDFFLSASRESIWSFLKPYRAVVVEQGFWIWSLSVVGEIRKISSVPILYVIPQGERGGLGEVNALVDAKVDDVCARGESAEAAARLSKLLRRAYV